MLKFLIPILLLTGCNYMSPVNEVPPHSTIQRGTIHIKVLDQNDPTWVKATMDAAWDWNDALGGEVFSFGSGERVIKMRVMPDIPGHPQAAGVYHQLMCNNTYIVYRAKTKQNLKYSVALHELGHSLGLNHSDNPNEVMYATLGYPKKLQLGDINRALKSKIPCI